MKARLIKRHNGEFYLRHPEGEITSHHNLSLKNCQAIERGYDLDELAEDYYDSLSDTLLFVDGELKYSKKDFKAGFQKALEILGDRKFTERDINAAIRRGYVERQVHEGVEVYFETYEQFLQSLQQNEWEVEIVREDNFESDGIEIVNIPKPKLDAHGRLILNRV